MERGALSGADRSGVVLKDRRKVTAPGSVFLGPKFMEEVGLKNGDEVEITLLQDEGSKGKGAWQIVITSPPSGRDA